MRRTKAARQQEDRAAHLGAGAVPRVLGNLGKSAQTAALNFQIEASNLWNFFQAKNIRRTLTIVAERDREDRPATTPDEAHKAAIAKQIDEWNKTAARYRSEPEAGGGKGEGTRGAVAARASKSRSDRDLAAEQVPQLRIRLGGVPDRHRARLGRRHHRHGGARLGGDRRSAWSALCSRRSGCSRRTCCTTSCTESSAIRGGGGHH